MRLPPSTRWLLLVLPLLACGCKAKPSGGQAGPPVKLDKPIKEAEIANLTLTPEAETRLDIQTAAVEERAHARTRLFGGQAEVPMGAGVTVSAPLGGTLAESASEPLLPGAALKKGQVLFSLVPTTAERLRFTDSKASLVTRRAEAEAAVKKAEVEVESARISLERAEKLVEDSIGSQERLDDAKARMSLARASLDAAIAQRSAFASAAGSAAGASAPIPIDAPTSGVLQILFALPGQAVAAGAPLFQVEKLDPIWIKVPVYAGDLPDIDARKTALVAPLGKGGGEARAPKAARAIAAPPTANPTAATVDLFYELDNEAVSFRPGQAVNVILTLKSEGPSLVVPWSAILHDIHGGTWVYENTAPHTYIRRRVELRYVEGEFAELASGPRPGAKIVTRGAAELFGTELGTGK